MPLLVRNDCFNKDPSSFFCGSFPFLSFRTFALRKNSSPSPLRGIHTLNSSPFSVCPSEDLLAMFPFLVMVPPTHRRTAVYFCGPLFFPRPILTYQAPAPHGSKTPLLAVLPTAIKVHTYLPLILPHREPNFHMIYKLDVPRVISPFRRQNMTA